jgi:hypothetical protein
MAASGTAKPIAAPANVITAFRSNLAYAPVAGEGFLAHKSPSTDSATNAITPANCNYNGVCNPYSGSAGPGYHNFRTPAGNAMFSAAVGANDVVGRSPVRRSDPQHRNVGGGAGVHGRVRLRHAIGRRLGGARGRSVADPGSRVVGQRRDGRRPIPRSETPTTRRPSRV